MQFTAKDSLTISRDSSKGGADLNFVALAHSRNELIYAANAGLNLDVISIALDAFIFLCRQPGEPCDNPETDKTQAICTEGLINWVGTGGKSCNGG